MLLLALLMLSVAASQMSENDTAAALSTEAVAATAQHPEVQFLFPRNGTRAVAGKVLIVDIDVSPGWLGENHVVCLFSPSMLPWSCFFEYSDLRLFVSDNPQNFTFHAVLVHANRSEDNKATLQAVTEQMTSMFRLQRYPVLHQTTVQFQTEAPDFCAGQLGASCSVIKPACGEGMMQFRYYLYQMSTASTNQVAQLYYELRDSPFRTADPNAACIFIYLGDIVVANVEKYTDVVASKLFTRLPYWGASGENHVIIHYGDYGLRYNTGRALLAKSSYITLEPEKLKKLSIASVPSVHTYRPDYDIVMPLSFYRCNQGDFTHLHKFDNATVLSPQNRSLLLTFKGAAYDLYDTHPAATRMRLREFHNGKDIIVALTCTSASVSCSSPPQNMTVTTSRNPSCITWDAQAASYDYDSLLLDSKFAAVIAGEGTHSYRLYEALQAGAVPVVLGDTPLPFSHIIPWEKIAVIQPDVSKEGLQVLIKALQGATPEVIARMQYFGKIAFNHHFKTLGLHVHSFIADIATMMYTAVRKNKNNTVTEEGVNDVASIPEALSADAFNSSKQAVDSLLQSASTTKILDVGQLQQHARVLMQVVKTASEKERWLLNSAEAGLAMEYLSRIYAAQGHWRLASTSAGMAILLRSSQAVPPSAITRVRNSVLDSRRAALSTQTCAYSRLNEAQAQDGLCGYGKLAHFLTPVPLAQLGGPGAALLPLLASSSHPNNKWNLVAANEALLRNVAQAVQHRISTRYTGPPMLTAADEWRPKIAILSLCAYDDRKTELKKLSMDNFRRYCDVHPQYDCIINTTSIDMSRPLAWSKIVLIADNLHKYDWIMWKDCDSFIMKPHTRVEDVILASMAARQTIGRETARLMEQSTAQDYAHIPAGSAQTDLIISEDGLMLNSGVFFLRNSLWAASLLRRIYGDTTATPMPLDAPASNSNNASSVKETFARADAAFGHQLLSTQLPFDKNRAWEQAGFILESLTHGQATAHTTLNEAQSIYGDVGRMQFVPQRWINSYPEDIARKLHDEHGDPLHAMYDAEDWIISFSGCNAFFVPAHCEQLYAQYAGLARA